jgi:hypothetical protein
MRHLIILIVHLITTVCVSFAPAVCAPSSQNPFPVIRQYSPAAKSKQNTIAKRYRSGSACPLVLTVGPCGFGFQLVNLPAHVRNLPLQGFLGHKERAEQVSTQIEKVRNRLEDCIAMLNCDS